MSMKERVKKYLNLEIKAVVASAVLGAAVGYVSFVLNMPLASLALAVIVLAVFSFAIKKALKISNDKKWWIGNVVVVYIFIWFIIWTIFYNL